jgi:hypothetical protein
LIYGPADKFIGEIPEKNLVEIESFKLLEKDMGEQTLFDGLNAFRNAWRIHLERNNLFGAVQNPFRTIEPETETENVSKRVKPAFKIVATRQDFDTRDMTLKGYQLEQNFLDPIVLQPVKEGYLVVSKWGDEANDEIVLNEKMN